MTNEEKARELATKNYQQEKNGASLYTVAVVSALEMAEWKDQQFKEYLENLKNTYIKDSNNLFNRGLTIASEHCNSQIECINTIINEFFGETEEVGHSNNDE